MTNRFDLLKAEVPVSQGVNPDRFDIVLQLADATFHAPITKAGTKEESQQQQQGARLRLAQMRSLTAGEDGLYHVAMAALTRIESAESLEKDRCSGKSMGKVDAWD